MCFLCGSGLVTRITMQRPNIVGQFYYSGELRSLTRHMKSLLSNILDTHITILAQCKYNSLSDWTTEIGQFLLGIKVIKVSLKN